METAVEYIKSNRERILEELFELLRIPSVSADKSNGEIMLKAADALKKLLLKSGVDRDEIMNTKGWPVVYAEKIIDRNLPTVLVYGHYDVQPPEPLNEWKTPPFEPAIRNENIYARGADDDKGQLFTQLKGFEYMVAESKLPCNVKFLIEGEEEIGSPSLKAFCSEHKKMLAADIILVSDTTMLTPGIPTLTVGLRGISYFELIIHGPNRDLHSGLFGGAVQNPANILASIIGGLKNDSGRVMIPGFYDDVYELSKDERKLMNSISFDEKRFAQSIEVKELAGEHHYTTVERLGIRPTLDVNGIWSGYTGVGAKTILPSKASAKISMRLVPRQEPTKIEELFKAHLKKMVPPGVEYRLDALHGGNPYVIEWDLKEVQAAVKAITKSYGKIPMPVRSGGSIPVIADFEEVLGIKSVLLGFGFESNAIHSPNEHFPLESLFKGIETVPWFYHYYMNPESK
jgi:acetylornithine deacetylase/succinyl-diaminopimelate desuccinylase-like protein